MQIVVVYCTIGFVFIQVRQRRQVDKIVFLYIHIVDGQLNGLYCGGSSLGNGAVFSSEISIVQQIVFCCIFLVQCHFAGNNLFVPHVGVVEISRDAVILCGEGVLALQSVKARRHRCVGGSVILLCDALNADGQFRRDDFPLCCGSSGVVAGTFDRQGDAVIGIGGLVAAYNTVGDGIRPAFQRHTGDLRRLLRRVVLEFAFFQRDGCALDGLGCNLDGRFAGHGRIFWCIRRKHPFGFIAVICSWRDCAILPCECAVDGCAGVGVFHRACDGARAQLVAIGNLACGDFAVRHGLDLVHCVEIERQIEDLVVIRGDINRDRSDLAGFPAVLCIDRQRQNTAVDPHLEGIDCIPGFKVGRRFATIEYRAIGSIRRGGQNLLGIIGVFQRRAVDHVQRAGLDTRGRSGFGDGEPVRIIGRENVADLCGTFRLTFKHIVFACERHGEGKRLSTSDLRRGQITPVRLLTGKLGVREGERRIGKFNIRRFAEKRQLVRSERDICTAVVGLGD